MVQKIYSKVKPELLLHIIHWGEVANTGWTGRLDLCDPSEPIQVAFLNYDTRKKFEPHIHVEKNDMVTTTQETWIVIEGKVEVDYYDIEGSEILESHVLYAGDCTITLNGGHSYRVVKHYASNRTRIYEVKTGPYKGKDLDKRPIE
jgi:mannose-6-phosphate isomerase-like protein (cupin superfamily)